jgi:nitrogen regulatory protein P-II 1
MKIVSAVVRTTGVEGIVKALEEAGVKGITIYEVQGTGDQVQLFTPYTVHKKIEVIVPDDRADEVSDIIYEYGHTGLAGDGFIAVIPVECVMKIIKKEKVCDLDFKGKKEVNL